MSDSNKAEPFATAGSGKSDAEVAFDLLNKLKGQGVWGEKNMPAILDMYAECLDAVKGFRAYSGQNRIEMPVRKLSQSPDRAENKPSHLQPQPQTALQTPSSTTAPSIPQPPAALAQGQPAQASAPNPVQSQQAQLHQQLYKQG